MWQRLMSSVSGRILARALASVVRRGAVVVLGYHDLRESSDPDSWLRVDVAVLKQQLLLLARLGTFIPPSDLRAPDRGAEQGLRFLVTFDDGYLNHFRLALPVLEELGIPGLFFVSTHNLTSGEPFWFDRVVTPIQGRRLSSLDLRSVGLREYRFSATMGPRRWDDVQALLLDIKRLGNPGEPLVEQVLDLVDSCGHGAVGDQGSPFRPLRPEELRSMASSQVCHIGSHGHRHVILPLLSDAALRENIVQSRVTLESVIGSRVVDIAYPNGSYDTRVVKACKSAGFERGYHTTRGLFPGRGHWQEIPRLLVGGYDSAPRLVSDVCRLLLVSARRQLAGARVLADGG